MTYAEVAAGGRVVQQLAAAAAEVPARLLPQLHPYAVLIDIQAVWRDAGREERNSFVLKALAVPAADVSGIYVVPETQLLRVSFESKVAYLEALAKLRRGVPRPEGGGRPVFGWAISDTVVKVRVCGVPEHLRMVWLREHLGQFGQVLLAQRSLDPDFPAASDGVVYVTLLLREGVALPHFIRLVDTRGAPGDLLMVHRDHGKRYCYVCGQTGHVGQFCKLRGRHPGAPSSLWSTLVVPDSTRLPSDELGAAPSSPIAQAAVAAALPASSTTTALAAVAAALPASSPPTTESLPRNVI